MQESRRSRKLVVVGLDGFSPLWLDRLIDDGRLPALASLRRQGSEVSLFSTLPATTPVAWASVSTGAWPSTHGVEGFLVHRPGDPFDRRVSGCYSTRCAAEPLWETATRAGLRSCVVKFPISYPSDTATLRVDGAAGWGGLHCLHELVPSGITDSAEPRGGCELLGCQPWTGAAPGEPVAHWRWLLPNLWGGAPVELYVALLRESREVGARPVVAVATEPDWGTVLGTARPGEFSPPLPLSAPDRKGNATSWRFRVRPMECATEGPPRLRLLNTPVHEHTNHSAPAGLWERHAAALGPIEEQTEPSLLFTGGVDVPALLDLFRLNADWLTNGSEILLSTEDPELFMVHAHFIDWAHHAFEGGVDPRHPDFDPDRRAFYEDAMVAAYQLGDRLLGAVRAAAGPGADVLMLGDHGQDLHHTTVRVNELLAEAGLLVWRGDSEEVDWSATSAYAMGNYVFVNTFGRDPEGIVLPKAVDETRASIVETLLSATDPARGTRPVLVAGGKEEFEALGAHGAGVGDVVFCLRSGYQARNDRGATFASTRLMREFTGGHDHFWPYDKRIQTRLLAAGPSFRAGHRHPRTERVIDVAPTAALALDIPPPRHSEGHPITGVLRDGGTNGRVPAGMTATTGGTVA